jgi:hypothetical protein
VADAVGKSVGGVAEARVTHRSHVFDQAGTTAPRAH